MRGPGRIAVLSVHSRGIGGIEFPCMQILEETPGRIMGFDRLEETLHVGLEALEEYPSRVCTLVALED